MVTTLSTNFRLLSDSATSDFDVSVEPGDPVTTVRVIGELDIYTAPKLLDHLRPMMEGSGRTVAVDLGGVRFIDSSGLGALVNALKQLRETGGDLLLRSPTPSTYKLFEITGLTRVFTIETR